MPSWRLTSDAVMGRRRATAIFVALCAVGMQMSAAAQGPPLRQPPTSSGNRTQGGTQTVSPTVVATHVAGFTSEGARVLELLVLWRGSPAWFTRASGSGTSGGGDGRRYNSTLRYGGLELQLEFDRQSRLAMIQGNRVDLGNDNVVFVDGVDAVTGLRVVRTLRIDPTMNQDQFPRIDEVMRRSPEILSFLQCDTRLSDPLQQKLADIVCANVLGN